MKREKFACNCKNITTVHELEFLDEIDCRDLFPGSDPRERIVIFDLIYV